MNGLEVSLAGWAQKALIANLMQLYVHDFSELHSGREGFDLDGDGLFPLPRLSSYWAEPNRFPLLFTLNGSPAGFALVNGIAHSGRPVDHNMAEFFVVRKHRRSGIGAAAACAIFERYPGRWEVAVARRNVGALAFWRRAIASLPLVAEVVESDLAIESWNGPVFYFRTGSASA